MKFLAVFVAVLAVASASRHRWTLGELSEAIQNPTTNPALLPVLKYGLNAYMEGIFSGKEYEYIYLSTGAVDLSTWTLQELSHALENPETDVTLVPYLEEALNALMEDLFAGSAQPAHAVVIPARDLSYWQHNQLIEALLSPSTSSELSSYLVAGLSSLQAGAAAGVESVVLAIPLHILPEPEVAIQLPETIVQPEPLPVIPEPEVPAPEVPAPESPAGSPLVQIILNINQESVSAPAPTPIIERPIPEITYEPAHIIERPIPEVSLNPIDILAPLPQHA
ncbi:microtubule-actin cross-linking factor 1, isoforms 6/7-like [Achroia grisella]|uniref:microtubule-actin cross-linking factor 1, isoforms 6/7-like n=1 Tax=Achroia grisella TaxID=688607 RepID=UPI0027D2121B|nr:microtubule-actin cross-linking factor 1, isoforms 6/7-like [Achroia grisella]